MAKSDELLKELLEPSDSTKNLPETYKSEEEENKDFEKAIGGPLTKEEEERGEKEYFEHGPDPLKNLL